MAPSETNRERYSNSGLVVAFCLAVLFLNGVANVDMLRSTTAPLSGRASDFAAFYAAGKIVADGSGKKLYDLETQTLAESRGTPHVGPPLLFYHPAFEAVLFAPLALLPYQRAFLVWNGLNLLVLLSVPIILRKHLPIIANNLTLSILALVCFLPALVTLLQGQDSILLLLCYALAFAAMRSQQDFRAGIFLGLALFKFQLVLPFVPLLAIEKRWRTCAGFIAAAGVLTFVSVTITGMAGLWEFPRFLWNANQHWSAGNISPTGMANLRGAIASTLPATWPAVSIDLIVLFCSALLFVGALALARQSAAPEGLDLHFAVMMLTTLMISYHLNPHDLTLLALPIAIGVNHLVTRSANRITRNLLVVSALLLLSAPIYRLLLVRHRLYLLSWVILVFGIALARAAFEATNAFGRMRSAGQQQRGYERLENAPFSTSAIE